MLQTNNTGMYSQCLSHTGPAPVHEVSGTASFILGELQGHVGVGEGCSRAPLSGVAHADLPHQLSFHRILSPPRPDLI